MKEQIKKVALAALIAAVTIAAQAGYFTFKISDVSGTAGHPLTGTGQYTAYFFSSYTYGSSTPVTVSQDTIVTSLKNGEEVASKAWFLTTNGEVSDNKTSFDFGSSQHVNASGSKAYLVIIDALSVAQATQYMITGILDKSEGQSSGTVAYDWGSAASSGLTWSAIPEPTSGLLLVLGMATLALKRRRV